MTSTQSASVELLGSGKDSVSTPTVAVVAGNVDHRPSDLSLNDNEQRSSAAVVDAAFRAETTSDGEQCAAELQEQLGKAKLTNKDYTAVPGGLAKPVGPSGSTEGDDLPSVEAAAKSKKSLKEKMQGKMAAIAMQTVVHSKAAFQATKSATVTAVEVSKKQVAAMSEKAKARKAAKAEEKAAKASAGAKSSNDGSPRAHQD